MNCYPCYLAGYEDPAVALCRSCFVALCGDHLAQSLTSGGAPIRYACSHQPGQRPRAMASQRAARIPVSA